MRKRFLFGAIGIALLGASGAAAETARITTSYGMAVIGLPIGKASFDTVIEGGRFTVEGQLSSSGLGSLVSDTGGTSKVSGTVTRRGFAAERYALDYSSDRKRWSSDVAFAGGRVTSSAVSPKRDKPKPSYVPVSKSQLSSVVDPLSGLMIRTRDAASVCKRTLPLYDGWSRLDLVLSPAGTNTYSMTGYSGEAVVCNAKVRPVSGYDKASKGLKFLKDQTIQVWFAPIAQPDTYVPVYAHIPTKVGPLTLNALSVAVR
ncbi:DUF3108 domain-containing protein [Aurantimonas sp. HBX-1]|uniref:DUF3108 domain-containing protein n=1 Tax=Aurantimonas sp. HBX-1 TaxID=2906072 RepID=UPI001F2A9689|nr:DUF3108 domain-containing protein [Aurantimonas sp. HBX-1]UIJ72426.1 DUF3108 domain-containing protein [Aurantimonas sp. HBX-1]